MITRDQGRTWPRHSVSVIDKEVQDMIHLRIVEPSFSPWKSHPVVVPKPDGKIRFCIDFRKLNAVFV